MTRTEMGINLLRDLGYTDAEAEAARRDLRLEELRAAVAELVAAVEATAKE
jgi:hypothetical protein